MADVFPASETKNAASHAFFSFFSLQIKAATYSASLNYRFPFPGHAGYGAAIAVVVIPPILTFPRFRTARTLAMAPVTPSGYDIAYALGTSPIYHPRVTSSPLTLQMHMFRVYRYSFQLQL